ncbi:hypothetical protein CupriaWKF_14535 [Cupriavidus sp. WKF15]|nr:hypothetical protein [Cupriavidus sp. WKF15]WER45506.1 hypothetical protein CupriaWKF_14535 [Cupriavidus sp. WKF15]
MIAPIYLLLRNLVKRGFEGVSLSNTRSSDKTILRHGLARATD